jgi:hypothetical protein
MLAEDLRSAAGLGRLPVPLAPAEETPRGRGLFSVAKANGETAITNIRRLAGRERTPGSGLVLAAVVLLAILAAGLFVVSLAAQYRYVFEVKHQSLPSGIEAVGLDAGMAVFSLLALGLAMAGQSARIERALIVVCAVASAGQNYAAADVSSPRSVAAYVMPPLFLALVVDRVVAVVRRHVLGVEERSVWATIGRTAVFAGKGLGLVLLYVLRFVLAPPSTGRGLRRLVLMAAPLPDAVVIAAELCKIVTPGGYRCGNVLPCGDHEEVQAIESAPVTEPPELEGATKKARLAWWYERDAGYGQRVAVAAAAKRLAGRVQLSEGTARSYLGQICDDLERRAS